ncbi:MAG: carbon storage regulator CsrA [Armatimonadetes bacterium]|nr:carbon storage regulator CsrA [Armatimonadota bacterium]
MLVLARKVGQSIVINDNVEVLIIEVHGEQVRLGIEAPRTIPVHRKELLEQIRAENVNAARDTNVEVVAQALSDLPHE